MSNTQESLRWAQSTKTPEAVLATLSTDADDDVRLTVAGNPMTPPDGLRRLADDPIESIREQAAAHPSLPPDLVTKLRDERDPAIFRGLARRGDPLPIQASDDHDEWIDDTQSSTKTDNETPLHGDPDVSEAQLHALAAAESALGSQSYSPTSLFMQLKTDGHSSIEARWATDRVSVNWNQQAVDQAHDHISRFGELTREALLTKLEFEGFTRSQAIYAANAMGVADETAAASANGGGPTGAETNAAGGSSAGEQLDDAAMRRSAVAATEAYLRAAPYSRAGLRRLLIADGYDRHIANLALDEVAVSWRNQAAKKARWYLRNVGGFGEQSLIQELKADGFSHEQAIYGARKAFARDTVSSSRTSNSSARTSDLPTGSGGFGSFHANADDRGRDGAASQGGGHWSWCGRAASRCHRQALRRCRQRQ